MLMLLPYIVAIGERTQKLESTSTIVLGSETFLSSDHSADPLVERGHSSPFPSHLHFTTPVCKLG